MSLLAKYNVIASHLITVVQGITGLENVAVSRGTPNTPNVRPALNIQHRSTDSTDEGNLGNENTTIINMGLDVLWMEEADFIDILDAIIDDINGAGRDACGVESIWVSGVMWEEEEKKYIKAVLQVTAVYWTPVP